MLSLFRPRPTKTKTSKQQKEEKEEEELERWRNLPGFPRDLLKEIVDYLRYELVPVSEVLCPLCQELGHSFTTHRGQAGIATFNFYARNFYLLQVMSGLGGVVFA